MQRAILAALATLAIAGCGGGSHQRQHVYHTAYGVQAHAPGFGITPPRLGATLNRSTAPSVLMLDTVNVSSLTGLSPRALAGYTSGRWPTYLPLVRAYPHAKVKSIAISIRWHAQCLDVEPGDAVPSQAVSWIRADRTAGFARPCIYTSVSEWAQVNFYLRQAGIPRSGYFAWDAHWTYRPGVDAGFDATQWTDHYLGRNIDASSVTLAFAGLQPTPVPKPAPRPSRAQVARWKRAQTATRRVLARDLAQSGHLAAQERTLRQRDAYYTRRLRTA
ncbi:MAG: hypothetical protein LC685_04405 [Actinobacteria bacterium]|nr:hypothetical protein [Actinomycetota bacterium]